MSSRRTVLSVPASEAAKVEKALDSAADEVVVDLEDAVAIDEKHSARCTIATMSTRDHGSTAVRVNGMTTPWFTADLAAVVARGDVSSIVVPKVESAEQMVRLESELSRLESNCGRTEPLAVQALIESAAGLSAVREIALASSRLVSLIIGYADLSASLGRHSSASWAFAQDAVLLAARTAGLQAIDGPLLSVQDDESLVDAADTAGLLGFDGKWVIHPRQIATVSSSFTPTQDELTDAQEIIAAMDDAVASGRGAMQWRGRMLDEAVVAQARRTLSRRKEQP